MEADTLVVIADALFCHRDGAERGVLAMRTVYSVVRFKVTAFSRENMDMDVCDGLACFGAVLDSESGGGGAKMVADLGCNEMDGGPQVCYLVGGEVFEARDDTSWDDEDVSRDERLRVDQAEAERGAVECLAPAARPNSEHESCEFRRTPHTSKYGSETILMSVASGNRGKSPPLPECFESTPVNMRRETNDCRKSFRDV
jgi:hypothetical protein